MKSHIQLPTTDISVTSDIGFCVTHNNSTRFVRMTVKFRTTWYSMREKASTSDLLIGEIGTSRYPGTN